MMNNSYYEQIINSFIKQKALINSVVCLDDDISEDVLCMYICALSNTAALKHTPYFYAFWGVNENTKTLFDSKFKKPNIQELTKHLSANIQFSIEQICINDCNIIVLEVQRAYGNTIQCEGIEYILVEKELKKLEDKLDISADLLSIIYSNKGDFCSEIAYKNLTADKVAQYLDWQKLFELLQKPKPNSLLGIMATLCDLRFVKEQNTGKYDITNLGALLLARKLSMFDTVKYKATRVLIYSGNNNTEPAHEQIAGKGYIVGFDGLIKYIDEHLPRIEYIDGALRKSRSAFPILSIRELVANAIIHQDLNVPGSPIISIFDDHIEISNPGEPMIDKDRFLDSPPISRNESLAAAMHRVGICEERGSGYDKVVSYIEENNLPAPEIKTNAKSLTVILRKEKPFDLLSREELIQICYNHTCLNYIQGRITNNTSLRARFNLDENERYKVSRIFKLAIESKVIKEIVGTGPKNREYLPIWVQ